MYQGSPYSSTTSLHDPVNLSPLDDRVEAPADPGKNLRPVVEEGLLAKGARGAAPARKSLLDATEHSEPSFPRGSSRRGPPRR